MIEADGNSWMNSVRKVVRYIKIYGFFRTFAKVLGRVRPMFPLWMVLKFPFYNRSGKKVGIIGSGHHAYSSLAYYLTTSSDCKIVFSLDVNSDASSTLAYAYGAFDVGNNYIPNKNGIDVPDIVYISSNHATHTEYAEEFINYGCDVYIEKPISINKKQLDILSGVMESSDSKIYVGYNRPCSPAVKIIRENIGRNADPISLSCFVVGHYIPADHWYRDSAEGTRIVANVGHWLDLSVHIMSWSGLLPEYLDVKISYTNTDTPSDNISISIVSDREDIVNIVFTSRSEPFEGVNETICLQQDDFLVKINDFRVTEIWKGVGYKKITHWPKNNGHKAAALQPFQDDDFREWNEIKYSTMLMLSIEEMVLGGDTQKRLYLR